MRKQYIKRALCITLVAATLLDSSSVAWAASLPQQEVVESQADTEEETTEVLDDTENITATEVTESTETEEQTEVAENTEGIEETETEEATETEDTETEDTESTEETETTEDTEIEVVEDAAAVETVVWDSVALTSNTEVSLAWQEVEDADGYEIYRKTDSGSYALLTQIDGASTTSYTDKDNFSVGVTYTYKVRAYVGSDESVAYGEWSEEKSVCRTLEAPVLAVSASTYQTVTLAWEQIEDADGYVIYRKASGESSYSKVTTVTGASTVSYQDTSVATGETYQYYMVAYCKSNNKTQYSDNSNTVKVKPALEQTVVSLSEITLTSAKVNWNKISGADGYVIYRAAKKAGDYTKIATLEGAKKTSYVDSDLKAAKTYYYKVRAYRVVNSKKVYASYSEPVSTTTCPTAPTVSQVSTSYSAVKVQWKSVALPSKNCGYYIYLVNGDESTIVGELIKTSTGYDVYRYKNGVRNAKASSSMKDTSDLTFKLTGLTHDKEYQIKVAGYVTKSSGKIVVGADSNILTATPKLTAVTITGVISQSYKTALIEWKATSDKEDYYEIYRKAESDSSYKKVATVEAVDGTSAYTYTDKKLTTGTKYTYKIRSAKVKGSDIAYSSYSSKKSATIKPAATTVKAASKSYNSVKLTWSKVKGTEENGYVTGYEIYRSKEKNGTYKKIATVKDGTKTSYTDTSLKTGTKYYYRIKAYCKVNKTNVYSNFSSKVSAKPVPAATKVKKAVSSGYNSVTITWSKVKGNASDGYVSGYAVYRSTSKDGKYKKIATIKSGSTQKYKDTNLSTGTKYYYKVKAYCKVSGKNVWSAASNVKSAKPIPAAPKISKISSKNYNTLEITWSKVKGASGYKIYRSTKKDGDYTQVGKVKSGSTTSYQDTGLKTGKKYYYQVRAYTTNKKGKNINSNYSSVKAGTARPEKVTGLKATPQNANRIVLTWNAVSGAKSYTVYRSTTADGTYKAIKKGITDTTYTNKKLTSGTTYYYKVVAVRNDTEGKMSKKVSAMAAVLDLSATKVTVQQGFTNTVIAGTSPTAEVTWSSDNPSVATVSGGVIYGVVEGTATITVKANGITRYVSVTVKKTMNGLDVSKWQGTIDFNAVKATGADFVMIRLCHGGEKDVYFETNYANARSAGLLIGVYDYTYATSTDAAVNEAYTVIGMLGGKGLEFPVAFDMEDSSILAATDSSTRTDIAWAFYNTINGASYRSALYANLNWLNSAFVNARLAGMDIWIARYRDKSLGHGYTGAGNVIMWQYSSTGSVSGISGNVDLDVAF